MYLKALRQEEGGPAYVVRAKPRNGQNETARYVIGDGCPGSLACFNLNAWVVEYCQHLDQAEADYPTNPALPPAQRWFPPENTGMCLRALVFHRYIWDRAQRKIVHLDTGAELDDTSSTDRALALRRYGARARPAYCEIINTSRRPHVSDCWDVRPCSDNADWAIDYRHPAVDVASATFGTERIYERDCDTHLGFGTLPSPPHRGVGYVAQQLEQEIYDNDPATITPGTDSLFDKKRLAILMTLGTTMVRVRGPGASPANHYLWPGGFTLIGSAMVMKCGVEPYLWDNQQLVVSGYQDVTNWSLLPWWQGSQPGCET